MIDARKGNAASDPERALSGLAETLLIPLYVRALESRRPDALLVDEKAVALVEAHGAAFARVERIRMENRRGWTR